jgi:DNA invertase Pin-like site-specific DNA recombinase
MRARRRTQPGSRTQPDGRVQSSLPKALGYVRVSTEEQVKTGVSLAAQLERIKAYALMTGLDLTRVISEDGVSGAKRLETRPGGVELSGAVAARHVEHVVALKLDRLFRDAEDALRVTRAWDKAGIALHVIDMGGSALNTASAMGRMFLTLTAAFAELERNLISERTSTALRHKRNLLKAYSPTPYGYDRNGENLTPNFTESQTLRRLKEMDAAGLSLRAMADRLNEDGVPTKRGGAKWYASTVLKILNNELHDE